MGELGREVCGGASGEAFEVFCQLQLLPAFFFSHLRVVGDIKRGVRRDGGASVRRSGSGSLDEVRSQIFSFLIYFFHPPLQHVSGRLQRLERRTSMILKATQA